MTGDRLQRQVAFLLEIDKLKRVRRQTYLIDRSRKETDAEHCWHVAMAVWLLAEHAAEPGVDVGHAMRMMLVHDLVEIDAGDTFIYDERAMATKADRERACADRLFALLPADQAAEFRGLWEEYEAAATPEARFAGALDRFQPLLHNCYTEGAAWREHGVTAEQVIGLNRTIAKGSPALWELARSLIEQAIAMGHLPRGGPSRPPSREDA